MGLGMPLPRHPLELFLAFTFVAFAFIGLGLVIAMMADNVPAVQALGQCIFLPMLIIGGVAVPLASLPDWAQRLSAFFPGRYAVEALQACVTGNGLGAARFSVLALAAHRRRRLPRRREDVPLGRGAAVRRGAGQGLGRRRARRVGGRRRHGRSQGRNPQGGWHLPEKVPATSGDEPAPAAPVARPRLSHNLGLRQRLRRTRRPAARGSSRRLRHRRLRRNSPAAKAAPASAWNHRRAQARSAPGATPGTNPPASWRDVTMADIDRDLIFTRLPPDSGVVTPIAPLGRGARRTTAAQLDKMRVALPEWVPGQVADPVQRVRNYLFVAAVPDVFQMQDLERFVPMVVYERIQEDIPKEDLIKILYWIATHPFDGDDKAVDELRPLGLFNGPADMEQTRGRLSVYAVKLLGRITGKITPE